MNLFQGVRLAIFYCRFLAKIHHRYACRDFKKLFRIWKEAIFVLEIGQYPRSRFREYKPNKGRCLCLCPFCLRQFNSIIKLEIHNRKAHKNYKKLQLINVCSFDNETFEDHETLQAHLIANHRKMKEEVGEKVH